jgi:hypothetical protein
MLWTRKTHLPHDICNPKPQISITNVDLTFPGEATTNRNFSRASMHSIDRQTMIFMMENDGECMFDGGEGVLLEVEERVPKPQKGSGSGFLGLKGGFGWCSGRPTLQDHFCSCVYCLVSSTHDAWMLLQFRFLFESK